MDIDYMLYKDTKWLSDCKKLSLRSFIPIAKMLDLRQEDWSNFWKMIRNEI